MTTMTRSNLTATIPNGLSRREARLPKSLDWRVIHACEYARDILPLVEGQVAVGMRPYIVTPQGGGAAEFYLAKKDSEQPVSLSLLRAWQDVRNWRKSLLECHPESSSDLVHAHSFASGMAGVRNLPCVVYDLDACIEEFAISAGLCERGSWMGRSFRVAEQFVLSHAQAVVVHSFGMKAAVEERGAPPPNVFLVPGPLGFHVDELPLFASDFLQQRFGIDSAAVTYFLPQENPSNPAEESQAVVTVLEAFALVVPEIPQSRLLMEASPAAFATVRGCAQSLGIEKHVLVIEQTDVSEVMRNATVVLATGASHDDPVKARRPNETCLRSLAMGKPLLAADVLRNRDGSPHGRGCLWFKENDVRDLAYRMAFLGRNPDFRATLAASGRAHILETRTGAAIGKQYDAAYRHALHHKKLGGPGQHAGNLQPVIAGNW